MKRNQLLALFFCVALGVGLASCGQGDKKSQADTLKENVPVLTLLDSTTYEFGVVKEGDIVEHAFRFRNDGEFPLIINNVTASCGCTIPEWPREPIAPKDESSILVRFNSKGKPGPQAKTITVYANTDPAYSELRLQGIVNAASDSTEVQ